MRMIRSRDVVGGSVATAIAVGGVFAVLAASTGATRPAARAAARPPLGSVTSLAWGLQTPVRERLVLRPAVSFDLSPRALRLLRATKPRLSGRFTARVVTMPKRGRSRTVALVSRRVNGLALHSSASNSILGRRLQLPRWVLSRKQTQAVKRFAVRAPLALTFSALYRVGYTNARGRTVMSPPRLESVTLPVALKRGGARGGDLRKLAVRFRSLLGQVQRSKMSCVNRNTILGRLRGVYGEMVSGNRTGAAAQLRVWIDYVRRMQAAGVLSGAQAGTLGSGLGAVLKRVGSGQSKRVERPPRWSPLPNCAPTGARTAQAITATVLVKTVLSKALQAIISSAAKKGVSALMSALWPNKPSGGSEPSESIYALIESKYLTSQVKGSLDGLGDGVYNFDSWERCCLATDKDEVGRQWSDLQAAFVRERHWYRDPAYSLDQKLRFLPLYVQYENMYLSVLREGIVMGPRWTLTATAIRHIKALMDAELDPNDPSSAVNYVTTVYEQGLKAKGSSSNAEKQFAATNGYVRDIQLEVLDFRDRWYMQDPMNYPYGDPNYRQNRMIYSEEWGSTDHTFAAPPNVQYPLSHIKAWVKQEYISAQQTYYNWLDAMKLDNSPLQGSIMGDTTTSGNSNGPVAASERDVAPHTSPGPVDEVGATWHVKNAITYPQHLIEIVKFNFAGGGSWVPSGSFVSRGDQTRYWSYPDEVLATAKIMGSYKWSSGDYVADAIVFGFRFADSFGSTWQGSLPGPVRTPSKSSCVGVERVPVTDQETGFVYYMGSRADGAALQIHPCDKAWDETWRYLDYNDPNDTADDAHQGELNVYSGTMCAAPKDGGTAAGTPVQISYCDGSRAQKWTRNATTGAITNDQSGLCLERAGGSEYNTTPIELNTCDGSFAQKWNWS